MSAFVFWEVKLNAAKIKAFARKHCNLETSEETAEKILINFAVKKKKTQPPSSPLSLFSTQAHIEGTSTPLKVPRVFSVTFEVKVLRKSEAL